MTFPCAFLLVLALSAVPSCRAYLAGTAIGTAGSYNNNGNTIAKALDGNLATYFDGPGANSNWVGLDLGSAYVISSVAYASRSGYASRMNGGIFQASSTADFSSGVVVLYTVGASENPGSSSLTTKSVNTNGVGYKYVRYLSPSGSYGDVSEAQFFGTLSTVAPTPAPTAPTTAPTSVPTLAPTTAPTSVPTGGSSTGGVTFTGFVYSSSVGVTSFNVNFQQAVSSLNLQHISMIVTSTGVNVPLTGSMLTSSNGGLVWTVSKPSGFYPASLTAQLTVSFSNAPPTICKSPVSLADISNPTTVVGSGTASSCTESAFASAMATGGVITFNCGPSPVTITLTSVKHAINTKDTIIDGKGLITLSGGGVTRIIDIQTSNTLAMTPRVTVQNLAFVNGYTTDVVDTTSTSTGGAALYRWGGAFTIINCDFFNNTGPVTGQDVGGGAVYSKGGNDTTIINSVFSGNQASNGGAIGNLANNFVMYNSAVIGNTATGNGGNPGNGGCSGGIYVDGAGYSSYVCGSTISNNQANQVGGAFFRVGYNTKSGYHADAVTFINSTISNNLCHGGSGGIYVQNVNFTLSNSTVMFNWANTTGGGLTLQSGSSYSVSGTTIANNTANNGLGGGIYIISGSGNISDTTIVGNIAAAAFGAGVAGGSTSTNMVRSIVAYSQEGNKYVSLSCNGQMNGTSNYQWPMKRADNNVDSSCTPAINFVDPMLNGVSDNGCVTWTAQAASNSPVVNTAGARCAPNSISPTQVLTYTNGRAIPRGPFSVTFGN